MSTGRFSAELKCGHFFTLLLPVPAKSEEYAWEQDAGFLLRFKMSPPASSYLPLHTSRLVPTERQKSRRRCNVPELLPGRPLAGVEAEITVRRCIHSHRPTPRHRVGMATHTLPPPAGPPRSPQAANARRHYLVPSPCQLASRCTEYLRDSPPSNRPGPTSSFRIETPPGGLSPPRTCAGV